MRISHRHRFVFFSNPKTGSESIRSLLDPYADISGVPFLRTTPDMPFFSHMRPEEARQAFVEKDWDFDSYYRFTCVRNPWARLLSLYQMICDHARRHGRLRRIGDRARETVTAEPARPTRRGFRRWLRTVSTDGPGGGGKPYQYWRRYGTYSISAYVCDVDGNELVDEIVPLRHLRNRLPRLLERVRLDPGLAKALPRINVRRYGAFQDWYDAASRRLVGRMYGDEIDRFGFRFDT